MPWTPAHVPSSSLGRPAFLSDQGLPVGLEGGPLPNEFFREARLPDELIEAPPPPAVKFCVVRTCSNMSLVMTRLLFLVPVMTINNCLQSSPSVGNSSWVSAAGRSHEQPRWCGGLHGDRRRACPCRDPRVGTFTSTEIRRIWSSQDFRRCPLAISRHFACLTPSIFRAPNRCHVVRIGHLSGLSSAIAAC